MLAEARKHIGLGEPNFIQDWFRKRNGSDYEGNFSWCDAFVTYCAYQSGNYDAVCPNGDEAYTPSHAQHFQNHGEWYSGTTDNVSKSKPGDIVFFDWGQTNNIDAIDHVGIIEVNLGGGRVQTIEGNTGDACKRKVRGALDIAGFGRPNYGSASTSGGTEMLGLKKGDKGEEVKLLQQMLKASGHGTNIDKSGGVDGDYGDGTAKDFQAMRIAMGSQAAKKSGGGDKVDPWGLQQLYSAVAKAAK
jgi:hypothetical protein